jgi:O-succinylbenzoate synthase
MQPFAQPEPARISGGSFRAALPLLDGRERLTFLLRLQDAQGRVGWGEAAPWPGWSTETVGEAELALKRLVEAINAGRAEDIRTLPASVQCAWEMACLDLDLWAGWPSPEESVPLAALAAGPWNERLPRFQAAWAAGARVCKLKVQAGEEGPVRDFLAAAMEWAKGEVRFRLDANRSMTRAEVRRWCEWLQEFPLEFWEEPLLPEEDWSGLPESGFAWARDESLRETDPTEAWNKWPRSAPGVLVLKPTLLGGLHVARQWAEAGQRHGWSSVVSGCYESGVGTIALGQLAARLPGCLAAGLDTHSWLKRDILEPPLQFPGYRFWTGAKFAVQFQ